MLDFPIGIPKIQNVEARQGYKLVITWETGRRTGVDLEPTIREGGVFEALADKKKFGAVRVGEGNKVIEWPDPADELGYPVIEIDSLALSKMGSDQNDASLLSSVKKALEPLRRRAAVHKAAFIRPG